MTFPSASRVTELCGAIAREIEVRIVAETGSTNADLLAEVSAATSTLDTPILLWAEMQTAGKGRAGRSWQSAADASLTFSLAWRFALPVQKLVGLPLAVGVAVAEVLQSCGVVVRLKWPNDILREGRKLGGILIETATVKNGKGIWAVIGIGINLSVPSQIDLQIANAAAAVPELQGDREKAMAILLTGLTEAMHLFAQQGFSAFAARWNRLHAHAEKSVNIIDHGKILHEGIAMGVDDNGALLLDTSAGCVSIVAGDVSLRPT